MDRWDPISLTSTFRPVLEPREAIQTTQDQVGLYDGRQKAEDYPNGTVYLTSHRILYIDAKDPVRKSIGLPLRLINGIQHYGGFMSSSPKITLDLYPRSNAFDPPPSSSSYSSDQPSSRDAVGSGPYTSLSMLSLKSEPSWVCPICYNSNQGSFIKCAICGVKKPTGTADSTPTTPAADPFLLSEASSTPMSRTSTPPQTHTQTQLATTQRQPPASGDGWTAPAGIACPACTFINDPFMIQCEICGTEVQDAQSIAFLLHRQEQHQRSISQLPSTLDAPLPPPLASKPSGNSSSGFLSSVYSLTNAGGSSKSGEDANSVKLSFRAGGINTFHTHLKAAMASRAWETKERARPEDISNVSSSSLTAQLGTTLASPSIKFGGISGIMRTAETNKKATDETLSQAFQDLQGLMDKAAEMVTLAESISNRLAQSNTMNNEETATFKTYLLSMGIAAPVTKDTAGAVFHKELARELVEFVLPVVEREGGTMSLMDVYCVFNRARGVELISPKDLHTACQMFTELDLPLRLRKFDSGLLVIQTLARNSDDEVSNSIVKRIQTLPPGTGLRAVELARIIQISITLAQEQLLMTEARGLIFFTILLTTNSLNPTTFSIMANSSKRMNVILGCMTFGPEGSGSRVKTPEGATEIISTFRSYEHTALDTARIDTDGNTENMMGQLDLSGLTVDTKVFPVQLGGLNAARVRQSLQDSLAALKTTQCHVFYLHAPDYATPIQETLQAIDSLYREGRFKEFGLSNYPAWTVAQIYYLCKINGYVLPTVYQGMYNAFTRSIEPELLACLDELNIRFHAYNPLCGGVLTGTHDFKSEVELGSRFDPNAKQGARYRERYWKQPYFDALEVLKKACEPHGLDLVQVAFDWLQFHSKMNAARGDGIIIGASSTKHTIQNLDALKNGKPLPQDVLEAVDRCWDITRESSAPYFRTKEQMMGAR
ncbi:Aflatoxin B1 aldehyde reductase member 2 [Dissophora globulifera]|nr:Aflatoxin B1 aldehyde reductase member 2 [Dissophora globulifera]